MSGEVIGQVIFQKLKKSFCHQCCSKWQTFWHLTRISHRRNIYNIGCAPQPKGRQLSCVDDRTFESKMHCNGSLSSCFIRCFVANIPKSIYLHSKRHLHTSIVVCGSKSSRKKTSKPVNVKRKGITPTFDNIIEIKPGMTIQQIANAMNRDAEHVFEVLLYIRGGEKYDNETAEIDSLDVLKEIVKKSGYKYQISQLKKEKIKENKDVVRQPAPDPSVLVKRPPVVTIMGHVDHGKTTLLDSLRKSNIVSQEFGGITQHIGAFSVVLPSGESITFLDTPGHAAFSAMRARGAQVTDIIVLVVAADDGVMQQTIESIQHAKNSNVPLVVAINKIDRPQADIERAKRMLLEHGVVAEDLGGDVQMVPISALQGTNLTDLQETIVTLAELSDLKADPVGLVEGRVIEAKTNPGRGKLVTAVVSRGTLKKGNFIVAGTSWAKVRALFNDKGQPIQEAPPSTPVEIIGWKELPSAGDEILQVESEQSVKEAIAWRKDQEAALKMDDTQKQIQVKRDEHQRLYQEELKKRLASGYRYRSKRRQKTKEVVDQHEGPALSFILKGDVDGSVEAILDVLDSYNSKKCRLNLIHYGVGNITDGDIDLAEAFQGEIFGFNVDAGPNIMKAAKTKNVEVKLHKVIYKLFDDLRESLSEKLPMSQEEEVLGQANVLQVFNITDGKKSIPVAGCRCVKGTLNRKMQFKLLRDGEEIYTGHLDSLKHHKNEVDTIKTDVECGLSLSDKRVEFQPGDTVVCFTVSEVEQDIDWEPTF